MDDKGDPADTDAATVALAPDATGKNDDKSNANNATGEIKTTVDNDLVDTDDDDDKDESAKVSRPQTICMKRKSLFETDGRAQAVSLAGATEIDMATHENGMMNAMDTTKEHYEYHLGNAGCLFLEKLNPYEQNLRERYARGELEHPSENRLWIANYYHSNIYKPYLLSQGNEKRSDWNDVQSSDEGKSNQMLQLQ